MSWADLYPISIYIIFSRSVLYHIVFSPVIERLEFLSLEVKYEIFRYDDDGTWHNAVNWYSQHKIVDPCPRICLGHLADGRSLLRWKNTHTHTHTHTLRVKCRSVFLVRIFTHSDWIWRFTKKMSVFSLNIGK